MGAEAKALKLRRPVYVVGVSAPELVKRVPFANLSELQA